MMQAVSLNYLDEAQIQLSLLSRQKSSWKGFKLTFWKSGEPKTLYSYSKYIHKKAKRARTTTTYIKYLFWNRDFAGRSLGVSISGRSKVSYIVSSDQPVFSSEPHSGQALAFGETSAPQFGQTK